MKRTAMGLILVVLLTPCASEPKVPYSTDFDPMPEEKRDNAIVLIGYSKGAADTLDCIVSYPETVRKE